MATAASIAVWKNREYRGPSAVVPSGRRQLRAGDARDAGGVASIPELRDKSGCHARAIRAPRVDVNAGSPVDTLERPVLRIEIARRARQTVDVVVTGFGVCAVDNRSYLTT
jgi:hypothetical protein